MEGVVSPRRYRNGNVDIMRFLASLLIVHSHLYLIGYPEAKNWAWVDCFFMLSGYFAMSHFQNQKEYKECGKVAMSYTFQKFMGYFPYVIVAELFRYGIDAVPLVQIHDYKATIKTFISMPFEMFLLTSSGFFSPYLVPIWYLSAMFITLPLLIVAVCKWSDIWPVFSFLLPILYYGKMGINGIRNWSNDLMRAFAYLALGTGLYYISRYMRSREWLKYERYILTMLELLSLFVSMYLTIGGKSFHNLLIFLFPMLIVLQTSGCTYSANIHGAFCNFLAKLSLPIFLFHWNVALLVQNTTLSQTEKIFCIYLGTILLSILVIFSCKRIKKLLINSFCVGESH